MEVRNRFKGLDLIDRVPDELWNEVHDIVQETGIKTIPMEKKCKKAKWLSGEAFSCEKNRSKKQRINGKILKEETELDSILGQAVNIRLRAWSPSQWTLNFVPSVYRSGTPMENQTPWIKEAQDLYLDSPLPKRICELSL